MNRPVGIDLFAGAGGMSLGFEQAGFAVAAALEIDPIHAAVHRFNFPNCSVIPRSIVGVSGAAVRAAARIEHVDVVFGGAPCQGFSLMGQRAIDDPRNSLVGEFVRLVRELDATSFVFENVKGLTVGHHRQFLDELIETFNTAGYQVILPWKVLNAAHYGVPQDRERLFIIGIKDGMRVPKYPAPFTRLPSACPSFESMSQPVCPSCRDALEDVPDADGYPELLDSDEVAMPGWGEPSAYARHLRCLDPESWAFGYEREWNPCLLTSSLRTTHTAISRRRFSETPPGTVEPISRFYRLSADGVSNTLRAGTDSARGAFTSPRPIHYAKPRCVTVREMARLHGYPDWFRFHETKWHGARQIGNSVPPPLARAVATTLVAALGFEPERPGETVELGATSLLRMDMSQAAHYWRVPIAIGKRDRKSTARKRKQEHIEMARASEANRG